MSVRVSVERRRENIVNGRDLRSPAQVRMEQAGYSLSDHEIVTLLRKCGNEQTVQIVGAAIEHAAQP